MVFSRYNKTDEVEGRKTKGFNFNESFRTALEPSIHRRMTISLQNAGDEEHTFLVRWSGNVDIDANALLNLTNETSNLNI